MSVEARRTLGVAVVYDADSRALRFTLASLSRQTRKPDKIVVIARLGGERHLPLPSGSICADLDIQVLEAPQHGNSRNRALLSVGDCDVAVLVREGVVLTDDFLEHATNGRGEAGRPISRLLTTDLVTEINVLDEGALNSRDPFNQILTHPANGRRLPAFLQSRYFTPSALVFEPRACRGSTFEEFATRSDWAAFKLFLDAAASRGSVVEEKSRNFGFIGSQPDRRGGFKQGRDCSEALYRLAEAYPRYRQFAWMDRKKLALEQAAYLFSSRRRPFALSFLKGMLSERSDEASLRARLKRDISQLT